MRCLLLAQVMAHHAVGCHAVVVARPGAIKKTTSGKVQRRACRAAFISGEYSQVLFREIQVETRAVLYRVAQVEVWIGLARKDAVATDKAQAASLSLEAAHQQDFL